MHFSEKDRYGRLAATLADLSAIVGGDEAYLFALDWEHNQATLAASTFDAPAMTIETSHPQPGGVLADLILRGLPVDIPEVLDPDADRPIDEILAPLVNHRSLIGLPVPDRGQVAGFILIGAARYRPIDEAVRPGMDLALKTLGKVLNYRREAESFRERATILQADSDAWQKRFSLLFDLVNDGIAVLDRGGQILEANPAYEQLTGYASVDLQEMSVHELNADDDDDGRTGNLLGEGVYVIRTRDGESVPVRFRREFLRSSGEEFILSVEASTEREREAATDDAPRPVPAEQAKPAPERSDDMRKIADEIRGHAESLSDGLPENANLSSHVFQILNAADRLGRIADGTAEAVTFGPKQIEEALTRAHAPKSKTRRTASTPSVEAKPPPAREKPAAAKAGPAPAPRAGKRPTALPVGHGTVLVVDDERLMNELAVRILSDSGFRVLSAGGGGEAIDILEAQPEEVDLVILDLIMPGVSGQDVFARIKELRPDLRVVLTSGFQTEDVPPELLEDENTSFLHKPYQMQELMRHVLGQPGTDPDES